jgi:dephospho-CoA kinase
MGKSTCAGLLRQRGIPVVDTDDLARDVVQPGQPALAEILHTFGNDMADPQGRLRREAMADHVFSNPDARRKLEAILHPRIRALWLAQVEDFRRAARPMAVVVIPLLFETGAESSFDAVVCVACTPSTQRERLAARGWSPEETARRIGAQLPVEEKLARSRFVIWTEGDLALHAAQVDRVFRP